MHVFLTLLLQQPPPPATPDWVAQIDTYAKVFGGVVALVVALIGVPVAVMQVRKTRVEIHKLELEAEQLQSSGESTKKTTFGYQLIFDHSGDNVVNITVDPRVLGPLLLLLDFVVAASLLIVANWGFDLLGEVIPSLNVARSLLLALVSVVLLVPIMREASRLRKELRPLHIHETAQRDPDNPPSP